MADPTYYLDINGLSKHLGEREDLNEKNYGFGITREKEDNKLVKMLSAGGYKNSFGDPSFYAAAGLAKRFGKKYYMDVGAMGGAVTGYENRLEPMAAALLSVGKKDLGRLNFMYAPETDKTDPLIMMNLGIPFK